MILEVPIFDGLEPRDGNEGGGSIEHRARDRGLRLIRL